MDLNEIDVFCSSLRNVTYRNETNKGMRCNTNKNKVGDI